MCSLLSQHQISAHASRAVMWTGVTALWSWTAVKLSSVWKTGSVFSMSNLLCCLAELHWHKTETGRKCDPGLNPRRSARDHHNYNNDKDKNNRSRGNEYNLHHFFRPLQVRKLFLHGIFKTPLTQAPVCLRGGTGAGSTWSSCQAVVDRHVWADSLQHGTITRSLQVIW